MEDTLLDGSENIEETNYQGNKNIVLRKSTKKKLGRPKGSKNKPKPTEVVKDTQYYEKWIQDNRKEFFSTGKKTKEFINGLYEAHNYLFNSDKGPGKCGICDYDIIIELKRRYLK